MREVIVTVMDHDTDSGFPIKREAKGWVFDFLVIDDEAVAIVELVDGRLKQFKLNELMMVQ